MPPLPSANDTNAKLAAELRGQTMHIPNLLRLYPDWPSGGRNKYYKRLKTAFDEILDRVIPDEARCEKTKAGDLALFVSTWYPEASWDNFYTCGLFVLWIFIWDDTIDTNEEALSQDFDASCRFREQSLHYIRHCLGLPAKLALQQDILSRIGQRMFGSLATWLLDCFPGIRSFLSTARHIWLWLRPQPEPICPDDACSIFRDFAQRARLAFDKTQCELLYRELQEYSRQCELEQKYRLSGHVPCPEEYFALRVGTSAVRAFCRVCEIALETHLPSWLLESPDMQALWRETNLNIVITNDILSLKRELSTDCVINIVPALYSNGMPLALAVSKLVSDLEECRDRFDALAVKLLAAAEKSKPKVRQELAKYIDGCRTSNTATIEFSIYAPRYGITKYLKDDGSLAIVL